MQFKKGDKRKVLTEETLFWFDALVTRTLKARFAQGKPLGRTYLDPELKRVLLPLSQRSASAGLVSIPRGSRIPFDPQANTIRFFVYWHETEHSGRVDVDLSAVNYGANWTYQGHVSYTNYSTKENSAYYSGDKQDAPNGNSEFIDINLAKLRKQGVRYIAYNLLSYTKQPFDQFICHAGVMERQKPGSGEPYEPTTVKQRFDVNGAMRNHMPMVLDLEKGEMIWADLALNSHAKYNCVELNSDSIVMMSQIAEGFLDAKPTLYDLLKLQAEARASQVDTVRRADVDYDTVLDGELMYRPEEVLAHWL